MAMNIWKFDEKIQIWLKFVLNQIMSGREFAESLKH